MKAKEKPNLKSEHWNLKRLCRAWVNALSQPTSVQRDLSVTEASFEYSTVYASTSCASTKQRKWDTTTGLTPASSSAGGCNVLQSEHNWFLTLNTANWPKYDRPSMYYFAFVKSTTTKLIHHFTLSVSILVWWRKRVCVWFILECYTGSLKWIENALEMISIRILEQAYYSDIRDLNPAIYMLINFSLKSQRNASLTYSKKHFIKPQSDHSANVFSVIVMKYRFVISRRDNMR